jgi:hypothetical protein
MTTDLIAAFIGVFGTLQVLSMLLSNLEIASKQIEGRSTWTAADGTTFEEFAVTELESSQIMRQDFDGSRAEAIMANHFAGVQSNG